MWSRRTSGLLMLWVSAAWPAGTVWAEPGRSAAMDLAAQAAERREGAAEVRRALRDAAMAAAADAALASAGGGFETAVLVDGRPVTFERPVRVEMGRITLSLRDVAAALGMGLLDLGGGGVQLILPTGERRLIQLASDDPALWISATELAQEFRVQVDYDDARHLLTLTTPAPKTFQAYTVPKPAEQVAAEEAMQALLERVAHSAEEPEVIPPSARPDIEGTGSVTYSYDDPHAKAPFRTLTTSSRGRIGEWDMAFESVRKDDVGVFQHDYTYLNLRKPGVFIGAFDQRTDLSPLRSQFEEFNGAQLRKSWGLDAGGRAGGNYPRFRPLELFPEERAATTLAWGETEQAVSGTAGLVTYLGQLAEVRHEMLLSDWMRLKGAMFYTENGADLPHLSETSAFPRRNFISFGDVGVTLTEQLDLSGQLARAHYQPDNASDLWVDDWDWRAAADWRGQRYNLRYAYEVVGDDYASFGDPATYQDYRGSTLFGHYRLTDRWSLAGSFLRYRNNVDDAADVVTVENQALSTSTTFQLTPEESVGLRWGHFLADPSGPDPGSSSRSATYGVDYHRPFWGRTRLLTSYEYFRTEATTASDVVSQTVYATMVRPFGRGSSWYVTQQARKTYRELEADTLNLTTTTNLNYQITPTFGSYLNGSYARDLTNSEETLDSVSAAVGLRLTTASDTSVGVEYEMGPYGLDTEQGRWPKNWSVLLLVTQRFGFATAPNFGALEGWVFQDLNDNGMRDLGEPGVAEAAVQLEEPRQTLASDAQGRFTASRLAPGTQTVTLDLSNLDPRWTIRERRHTVTVRKRRATAVHFPLIPGATIRARVFIDTNGDGVFQETEEPLEGMDVLLMPTADFRTSDSDGQVAFDDLLPGAYTLQFRVEDLPGGYELTSPPSATLDLKAGEERQDAVFAVRFTGAIQRF